MVGVRGSTQEKWPSEIFRFGYRKAENDKKVPDPVGSEVFALHKFVLTIPHEAGRSCLMAAANMKQRL